MSWWIAFGPQLPGAYGLTGGGASSSRTDLSQRLSMPVRRGEERVVAAHRVEDQPLVRLQDVAGVVGLSVENCMLTLSSFIPEPGRLP